MATDDSISQPEPAPQPSTSRRRWLRFIIGLIVVNALVLVGILVWSYPRFERVDIIDPETPPATRPSTETLGGGDGGLTGGGLSGEETPGEEPLGAEPFDGVTFLVMGSDTREDLPTDLGVTDDVAGRRADLVMVVTLDGDSVRLLSLPRDLKVEIEGTSRKLNAAYAIDGPNPQLLYDTVEKETGIDIDYYLELDFFGFASVIDVLGGVEITFPYRARDLKSHLNIEAGSQRLDGKTALAYARSRQYQEYRDGAWVSVDVNDLGRIRRQQSLLFAMLAAFKDLSVFDVNEFLGLLRAAEQHIRIDSRLSERRLIDLVLGIRGLDRENIEAVALPVTETVEDGVYYLLADQPAAIDVIASFLGVAAESAGEPSDYEPPALRVLNGNGGSNQAAQWKAFLEDEGFEVRAPADAAFQDFAITIVTVRPGELETGLEIVDALGFGQVEAGSVEDGLDAVVIIGADALGR